MSARSLFWNVSATWPSLACRPAQAVQHASNDRPQVRPLRDGGAGTHMVRCVATAVDQVAVASCLARGAQAMERPVLSTRASAERACAPGGAGRGPRTSTQK